MIFASAGTQLPFDRFIEAIDELAPSIDEEIVVQSLPGKYKPKNITLLHKIPHNRFINYIKNARIVVAHAGIGTMLSAMYLSKPIIIFPRLSAMGEHRNDHQNATADVFEKMNSVYVARDIPTLVSMIMDSNLSSLHTVGPHASTELIEYVDNWIGAK